MLLYSAGAANDFNGVAMFHYFSVPELVFSVVCYLNYINAYKTCFIDTRNHFLSLNMHSLLQRRNCTVPSKLFSASLLVDCRFPLYFIA